MNVSSTIDRYHHSGRSFNSNGEEQISIMWRLNSIMRILFYALLIIFSLHQLSRWYSSDNESTEDCPSCSYPPIANELCQFLEHSVKGSEGSIDSNEYKLKGITVVFRHGERSPIIDSNLSSHSDCVPFRDSDRKRFEEYRSIIDSDQFNSFIKVDDMFKNWKRYPERSKCVTSMMTAEGALQHSRLGVFFRRHYENTNLFNEENRLKVMVTSSNYVRTFQSAIAFLSSFLFPMKGFVDQVFIKGTNMTYLCADEHCKCDIAPTWRAKYEEEHLNFFLSSSPLELREKAQRIFGGMEISNNSKDPFQMLDVMLGRYVCRRSSLPCTPNGECVSYELLQELIDETSRRSRVMYESNDKSISKRLQLAEAQAVLGYVDDMGERLKQFPHTNIIKIFSGHDSTVAPILRALDLPFIDFPHYASRITFEIYHNMHSEEFIRILYNGDDRTPELPFCQGKDLCPLSTFSQYIRSGLFNSIGFSNKSQLCDPSLISNYNVYV